MDIVYNKQSPKDLTAPSLFLAGPTTRDPLTVSSWRPQAIEELHRLGFPGTVFVPEPAPGDEWPAFREQVEWEHRWLNFADCVLFWIPRNMATLPGMTTNIEYGLFMRSGKAVVGAPPDAEHIEYIRETADMHGIPFVDNLPLAARLAVSTAETPQGRILSHRGAWRGKFVRVELTKWLDRLGRVRDYETLRRNTHGDVVSVFALTDRREVVLVKQYRVPQNSWVIEKPAGLADKKGEAAAELAARELQEETGYCGGTPMELVLRGPFDSGFNDDIMSVFFTKDAVKLQEPQLEPAEDLETVLVPLDDLVDFVLHPPDGCLVDMKLLSTLPILQAKGLI